MTENWILLAAVVAWVIVQLARILASSLTARRRDQIKAGRMS